MTQEQRSLQGRPIGVMLISTLALLWSAVTFLEAFTLFSSATAPTPWDQGLDTGTVGQLLAFGGFGIAVLYVALAFGLWNLHRWAWWLALGVAVVHVAGSVAAALLGGPTWAAVVVTSIVPVVIGAYLLTPGVRRAFGS